MRRSRLSSPASAPRCPPAALTHDAFPSSVKPIGLILHAGFDNSERSVPARKLDRLCRSHMPLPRSRARERGQAIAATLESIVGRLEALGVR